MDVLMMSVVSNRLIAGSGKLERTGGIHDDSSKILEADAAREDPDRPVWRKLLLGVALVTLAVMARRRKRLSRLI